jgi:hypothetical protein
MDLQTKNSVPEALHQNNIEQTIQNHASIIDFNAPLPFLNYDKELDIEIKSNKPLSGKQHLLLIPITKFFKKYRNIYLLINILNGRSIISLRLIEYFVVNYVLENNTHYNLTKYKNKQDFIVDNLFTAGPPTIDITKDIESTTPEVEHDTKTLKDEIRMSILETKIKNQLSTTDLKSIHLQPDKFKIHTENFDDYFLVHDNYKCQLKEYNKKNFDPFCRWTRIRMYYDKTKFFYTTVAQLNFFKWAIENYVLDYILDNLPTIEKAMNDYERAIKKEKKIRKLNMLQINATGLDDVPDLGECQGAVPIAVQNNMQSQSQQVITNTALNIDTSVGASESGNTTSAKKVTHTLFSTLDKKSKIKGRKKKEFTKTNRSILKYNCTKIVNFD